MQDHTNLVSSDFPRQFVSNSAPEGTTTTGNPSTSSARALKRIKRRASFSMRSSLVIQQKEWPTRSAYARRYGKLFDGFGSFNALSPPPPAGPPPPSRPLLALSAPGPSGSEPGVPGWRLTPEPEIVRAGGTGGRDRRDGAGARWAVGDLRPAVGGPARRPGTWFTGAAIFLYLGHALFLYWGHAMFSYLGQVR